MTAISSKSHYRTLAQRRRRPSLAVLCFRYSLIFYIMFQSVYILIRIFDEPEANLQQQRIMRDERSSSSSVQVPDVVYHSRKKATEEKPVPRTADDFEVKPKNTAASPPKQENQPSTVHHGTGPAKHGYVIDLVQERQQQSLWKQDTEVDNEALESAKQAVEGALGESAHSSGSCRLHESSCKDKTLLAVYNAAPFPRYLKTRDTDDALVVPAHEAVSLPSPYSSATTTATTTLSASPIQLLPYSRKDDATALTYSATTCKGLPVECQIASSMNPLSTSEKGIRELAIHHQDNHDIWKMIYTTEDPYYNGHAKIERTAYQSHTYYSTLSFKSAVPLTFFQDWPQAPTPPPVHKTFETLKEQAVYIANDQCSAARRNKWFDAISAAMTVASYGSCGHNTPLPPEGTLQTPAGRIKLYQDSRIALILEAGVEKDYITSQVWEALESGVVPAIYGATNIKLRLPEHSAIVHNDFQNWDTFAAYIHQVATNQTLWDSYQTWRSDDKVIAAFRNRMVPLISQSAECRICAWAYAKQKGHEWNVVEQAVVTDENAHIPKQTLCVSKGALVKPFQEQWPGDDDSSVDACETLAESTHTRTFSSGLSRTVTVREGVVDMEWENAEATELMLKLAMRNGNGAYFRNTHTLVNSGKYHHDGDNLMMMSSISVQDEVSKITILLYQQQTSEGTAPEEMSSPQEGIVRIPLSSSSGRMRIIIETMDTLYDKMTEYYPSSFGQRMMHDFMDPLEFYYSE